MKTYQVPKTVRYAVFLSAVAVTILLVQPVRSQDLGPDRKVGGLPVGIVKDALSSVNAAKRQRLFALVKQRIYRDAAARQRFLAADVTTVGPRLARFKYSVEMLTAARSETSDAVLQAKIDELVAAIMAARASAQ